MSELRRRRCGGEGRGSTAPRLTGAEGEPEWEGKKGRRESGGWSQQTVELEGMKERDMKPESKWE